MDDQELIKKLNKELENDIKETEKPIPIGLTSYDKELLKKECKLKKIAITKLVATGVGLAMLTIGCLAIKSCNKVELVYAAEIENNLEKNEMPITEQLAQYEIAVQDYLDIIEKPNYNKNEEIEKRVELAKQVRNLTNTANFLMQEKIKEALQITNEDVQVDIYRDSTIGTPIDCVAVKKEKQEIYKTTKVPSEIRKILNYQESINSYNGSGENEVWKQAITEFMRLGNRLYNSIVKLSEKEFEIDNGNIKCQKSEKSI